MRRLIALAAVLAVLLPGLALAQTPEPEPEPFPLPVEPLWTSDAQLELMEVDLDIRDGSAVAHYELHFSNTTSNFAEGRVVIPVPPNSSVSGLTLSGGPETLEGKILDADDALRIYEDIVRRLIDPALLQSLGGDLYEIRAFPVPMGEERQVSFSVTTPLLAEGDQAVVSVPWSRMSPRPESAILTGDTDLSWEVRSLVAPTHPLDTQRQGPGQLTFGWESPAGWSAATDFTLYLTGGEGLLDTVLLSYRIPGDDGFFALLLAPVIETDTRVPRDVILVLDTSGSMDGEKIVQARDAARFILERLGPDDRFGIVAYATAVSVFDNGLVPASRADDGIAYVNARTAAGSTNISGALQTAMGLAEGDRPATVVFLTDGLPTTGLSDPAAILDVTRNANPGRTQLFAFGVGFDVNTVLLDSLTREFVGTSHYVTPDERIDTEVSRLYERISAPVLTDVQIGFDGGDVSAVAPAALPGIFAGAQTLLTGRYGAAGALVVEVSGNTLSGPTSFTYELDLPERALADPTIAQLWAQQRVADLLAELRIEGERPGLVEEIVDIATRFGIVTPYTSFLAEEPELVFFTDDADLEAGVAADALAAPTSGEAAVGAADQAESLREGGQSLGANAIRVVGSHSYTLVDGVWIQDGYELGDPVKEIVVGSEEFGCLIDEQPDLAGAAGLGPEVIAQGPPGFIRIVWPDPDSAGELALPALEDITLTTVTGPADDESGPSDSAPTDDGPANDTTPDAATLTGDASDGPGSALWIGIGLGAVALVGALALIVGRRARRVP